MAKVHTFGSTRNAYDASQCWESIKDGDILHVPSESVVGFLYDVAWPVAVTEAHGLFGVFTCAEGTPEMIEIRERYAETFELAAPLIASPDVATQRVRPEWDYPDYSF